MLSSPPITANLSPRVPVLIAGGGPVGLTLAALLSHHDIASLVIEADDGYCTGSRAICVSRRSMEILGWIGADQRIADIGRSLRIGAIERKVTATSVCGRRTISAKMPLPSMKSVRLSSRDAEAWPVGDLRLL